MTPDRLLAHFDRLADAPDAIPRLRRFILDLAVRGKLVEQDPTDEPASAVVAQMENAKRKLDKRRTKPSLPPLNADELPHDLPPSWKWIRVGEGFIYDVGTKRSPHDLEPNWWLLELEDIEKDTSVVLQRLTVEDRKSQSTKSEFQVGDILYGKLRPYLNKVVVATEPGYSTTEIVAIRPLVSMCSGYCCLAFRRPDFVAYVKRMGQGTKMPRLRTQDAVAAPFPLPPLAEQRRIVARVDELMALCDQLEAAQAKRESRRDRLTRASLHRLNQPAEASDVDTFRSHARFALDHLPRLTTRVEHIAELRQTILNLAVRGKLVEQDPNDEPASELIKQVHVEKQQLIRKGRLRKEKAVPDIAAEDLPFAIPASWNWSRIGTCALLTEYGTSVKSTSSMDGVPVVKMGDIQGGTVKLGGQKTVPRSIDDLPKLYLKRLDLLYNRTNSAELVGKTGIYLGDDDAYTFASYLIRIRFPSERIDPRYINLAMNAPYFRETQIVPELKQQCGQANVNGTKLRNMLIPIPPRDEQHRVVVRVDELMKLCDRLEARLAAMHADRTCLLEMLQHEALEDVAAEIDHGVEQENLETAVAAP